MKKIKRNDKVIVLKGKDKGRSGVVIRAVDDACVLVEGVNMIKKTVKPNPHTQTQGGIVDREAPIRLSNLALLNPQTNKADRVGFRLVAGKNPGEKPKKARYFKSNNELVDV